MHTCIRDNKAALIIQRARKRGELSTAGLDMEQRHHIGGKMLLKFRHQLLLAIGQIYSCPQGRRRLCNVLQPLLKFDD